MSLSPVVREAARRWIANDPDAASREELHRLLASAEEPTASSPAEAERAAEELAERMAGPLRFGTAGLRAPVRAGPAGMNVAVVRRVTAGLAAWLSEAGPTSESRVVIVGRDARRGSAEFAKAAAEVLAGAGFEVRALAEPLPTPVLAYAVRATGAVAGVQITASHNPPGDNGYKVYLGGDHGGAQLVEPADAQIEAAIDAAPPAREIHTVRVAPTDPEPLLAGYVDRVAALPRGTARDLRIALTPLHGVGGALAVRALRQAGFTDVHLVASQAEPDPDFPTVAFPNPEEPGAVDALLALAADISADLAVALDPDADRCALGVPDPTAPGGWRMLTGNQVGVLLGDHILATLDRASHPDPLVVTTLASSTQLRAVAAARSARYIQTLTGFKWIVRAGQTDGGGDPGFAYGYEEALGYCVDPTTVRDKDGIAAAVLAADLTATRHAAGSSLLAALDELARAHGVYLTAALTVRCPPARRERILARLATDPRPLGGVNQVERPAPDVFVLRTERARAVVRPSGTEPKLKAYLEVVEPPPVTQHELARARARASRRLAQLRHRMRALLEAAKE